MNNRAKSSQHSGRWWQALLGAIAIVLAALLILNPEVAALGFALDAAFFDMLVLLIGLQLRSVSSHLSEHLHSAKVELHRLFIFTCYGIRT